MQIPMPTKSRLIVFSVPIKLRIEGSLLYRAKPTRYSYSGCQECWIVSVGPEVKDKTLQRGMKAYVHDGFEFERIKMENLWDDLKDLPEFAELLKYVDDVDGVVRVEIVPEGSVLAVQEP